MSKFNLIAVAIAAALVAPAALAVTITPPGVTVNSNQFDDNASPITIGVKTVAATASDSYLGRTVGYNVRVTLSAGKISTPPNITYVGGAGGSASLITGTGAIGATDFVVRVVPETAGTQVGEGFTITGLAVDNLVALGAGSTLALSGVVSDPTTGATLPNSSFNVTAVTTAQGVAVNFTPKTNPNVVDVGQPSSKKFFTEANVSVGSGSNAKLFDAGTLAISEAVDAGWLSGTGTTDISITGDDFSAFRTSTAAGQTAARIFLATDDTCATQIGGNATISTDNKTAAFTGVVLSTLSLAAPFKANVCFDSNSVTQMVRQDIKGSAVVKPGAGFLNFSSAVGNLASMNFNGPVVNVMHFNPASNVSQVSYLRISNTSTIGGKVSIDGVCDNGDASTTPVGFNLDAGKSILLTSSEVQNGNALKGLSNGLGACPAGKYRLTVTGEFSSMQVQNFLRNDTSVGTVNANVNNAD